jgi:hypothetical protein
MSRAGWLVPAVRVACTVGALSDDRRAACGVHPACP